jgi:hypothetical protein
MLKNLTKKQRQLLAGKIMDWGNLAFVGLTISQFIPGPFDPQAVIFVVYGCMCLASAYLFALWLTEGGDQK